MRRCLELLPLSYQVGFRAGIYVSKQRKEVAASSTKAPENCCSHDVSAQLENFLEHSLPMQVHRAVSPDAVEEQQAKRGL